MNGRIRFFSAYIERKALLTVYLEEEQRKQLEAVAEEKDKYIKGLTDYSLFI